MVVPPVAFGHSIGLIGISSHILGRDRDFVLFEQLEGLVLVQVKEALGPGKEALGGEQAIMVKVHPQKRKLFLNQ